VEWLPLLRLLCHCRQYELKKFHIIELIRSVNIQQSLCFCIIFSKLANNVRSMPLFPLLFWKVRVCTCCGETLAGVVSAFGARDWLTDWILLGTNIPSRAEHRARHSHGISPGWTGTQSLTVVPSRTGMTLFLTKWSLEPAWWRH